MKIINRDEYLNKLIARMNNGLIKAITGRRKRGKSFLLFTLFKEYLLRIEVMHLTLEEYQHTQKIIMEK